MYGLISAKQIRKIPLVLGRRRRRLAGNRKRTDDRTNKIGTRNTLATQKDITHLRKTIFEGTNSGRTSKRQIAIQMIRQHQEMNDQRSVTTRTDRECWRSTDHHYYGDGRSVVCESVHTRTRDRECWASVDRNYYGDGRSVVYESVHTRTGDRKCWQSIAADHHYGDGT